MILDLTTLNGSAPPPRISEICAAIRAETRDTDLYGWYKFSSAIGVIFTTLRTADRATIQSALAGKTDRALHEVLPPAEVRKVAISFHFFPEEIDKNTPAFKSDEKLYPDLRDQKRSRVAFHFFKRTIDILGSLVALIIFSPLFLVISISVKLTSNGPVLFKQRRIGKFGKEFAFLKFRTMHVNTSHEIHEQYIRKLIEQDKGIAAAGKAGPVYKIVNDPRVTRIGHFLRKSSLDELPQFLNVLKGDMSLVGPRPPIPYEVTHYRSWHKRRVIEVKPGITGLWQVYGRSKTTFDEMVRLDIRYIKNQSGWLDFKIVLKTPGAVFSGSGAY
ncbi:MAG: sugar transferase [Acidobacteriia bacterium]|nr:sugar transferase [Terriglobia bacterium]